MFLTGLYRMFFDTMVPGRLFVPDNLSQIQALGFSEYNLRFAAIVFIMFLFTSHYYFSQARKNEFLECASVTATGKNGFIMNQFSVMLTLALITCGVSFLLSIIFSFKDPNADGAYFFIQRKNINFIFLLSEYHSHTDWSFMLDDKKDGCGIPYFNNLFICLFPDDKPFNRRDIQQIRREHISAVENI